MNSLLTTLAGSFAKPLVLSALLPIALVSSLFLTLTYPLFPSALTWPGTFAGLDREWQLAWTAVILLVGAMLLYVLNTAIVRLLSGYGWKDVFPGTLLVRLRRHQFRTLRAQRDGLSKLENSLDPNDKAEDAVADRINTALTPLAHRLNDDFPYDEALVLPTKLGNVIRNFEDYSRQQYGISAVPLWPRLLGVLDARYATVLDEAKTSFDFALNTLVLLIGASAITIGVALSGIAAGPVRTAALWRGAFFGLLAALAYTATVNRARVWGTFVKAAVDLHRIDLMKKVGYQYTFADIADEKERFWSGLVSQWSFPDMPEMEAVPFAPPPATPSPPTSATSGGAAIVTIARGVAPPSGKPFATMTVTLRVVNTDPSVVAKPVTIGDAVPPNWSFVWGSATTTAGALTVRNAAPILFEIDQLAAGATCTVQYQLQSLIATP